MYKSLVYIIYNNKKLGTSELVREYLLTFYGKCKGRCMDCRYWIDNPRFLNCYIQELNVIYNSLLQKSDNHLFHRHP